ncbi:chemotaxis protein CheA [Tissierella sp. Yu-01]|uniref:chemotaxis protein CheA n=1 Tax=Tissierella sp. Yu-01 TaxID=3035694 RepID=UPI00240E0B08|nr:chemotaxis protein CheA [Tissierella sp. Yu-01]WFA07934.1 chemotaxis protein CheA [Tissierella sp. Yu-01]
MDDNSKYRDLFFEETDEYLQTLNECLLELEKDPEDSSVLDEIFRAAHTLKGMAATMGYKTMSELTHSMESVLELYRNGKNLITSEIISLVFKCLDRLSEIVEDIREEKYDEIKIEDLVLELSSVAKGGPNAGNNKVAQEVDTFSSEMSETDKLIIHNANEKGYNAYNIIVTLEAGCLLKGARAYLVVNKLEQNGEIIHTEPTTEKLEEGDFENSFNLIYLSKEDAKEIKELIEDISEIEKVSIEKISLDENLAREAVVEDKQIKQTKEEKVEEVVYSKEKDKPKSNIHHASQSIRVDINKLDNFMNLVSELVIYRTRLEDISGKVNYTEINEPLEQVARITSELQDLVLKIRMEPVNVVFNRFPRMVRDLTKELKKEIELVIEGEETELDRTVVSELGEPLIHLIRNAADHGIESVEKRKTLGKSETGLIKLSAYQEGNRVVITVSDDGKGIDPEAIRESAIRKGIDVKGLGEKDLIQLIFHQGFSTAKQVTNVSGRGVGMDVVRQKIISLGGSIEVHSEVNVGTDFIIKLPLTLSIIQSLMVEVGRHTFAVPLGIIDKVVRVEKEEIFKSHSNEVYMYRGKAIPVIRVNEKLSLETTDDEKHIILIQLGDQHYGLLVDGLIGQQEIVIKKLTGILSKMKEYLGATILGNGDITLILDAGNLCSERTVEKIG